MDASQHTCWLDLVKHMKYQSPYLVMSAKTLMAHVNEVPGYYYREYTGVSILSRVLALAQN